MNSMIGVNVVQSTSSRRTSEASVFEKEKETGKPAPLWTRDFLLICLANLFLFMNVQVLLPTLPLYIIHVGSDNKATGMIMGSFTIAAMIMRPAAGMLLDRFGRKIVLLPGIAVTAIVSVSYHFAGSILLILLIRLAHGGFYSISTTATGTIVSDLLPRIRLGEGMGYFGITSSISMAISPLIGLWIVEHAGFTVLFNVSTVLVLLALVMGVASGHKRPEGGSDNRKAGFVLLEKKALPAASVMFFLTTVFGAIIYYVSLHAAHRGVSNIGLFFTFQALGMMIFRPLAGRWVDKRGANYPVITGLILTAISTVLISYSTSLVSFTLAGFAYGVGFGFCMPPLQALAVRDVPQERRGAATGTFFSAFDLGIGLGAIVWGWTVEVAGYPLMYLLTIIPVVIAGVVYLKCSSPFRYKI